MVYKKDIFFIDEPSKNYLSNDWHLHLPEVIKSSIIKNTYCNTFYTPYIRYNTADIGGFGLNETASVISLFKKINDNYRLEFTDNSCMTISQINDVEDPEVPVDSWWLVRFVDDSLYCQIIGIVYIKDNFCYILGDSAYYIAPNIYRVSEFSKKYGDSNSAVILKRLMLFGMYKVVNDNGKERIAVHGRTELAGYRKIISSACPPILTYTFNLFTNQNKSNRNAADISANKDGILQEFNEIKNANIPMISLKFNEWKIVQQFYNEHFIYQNKACNLIEALTHQPYGAILGFPIKSSNGKAVYGTIYIVPKIDGSSVEFTLFYNARHLFVTKIKLNYAQALNTIGFHNIEYIYSYVIITNMKDLPINMKDLNDINPLGNNAKEALEHLIMFIPLYVMLYTRLTTTASKRNKGRGRKDKPNSSTTNNTNDTVDSVIKHILKVMPNYSSNTGSEPTHRSRTKNVRYVIKSWVCKGYTRTDKSGKTVYIAEHVCNRRMPLADNIKIVIKM